VLRAEARWIGKTLSEFPITAFPLLNLGSSTEQFRRLEQPWIDELIFAPLRERNCEVHHVDLKSAEGVDVVADVATPEGRSAVSTLDFGSVLCSNLLEHLLRPEDGVAALLSLTRAGHRLVVTGPRRFPPHPDPIDNGFRATPDDLAALFAPAATPLVMTEVSDRLMLSLYAEASEHGVPGVVAGLLRPWRDSASWAQRAVWSFRRTSATCLLLERT
jgi:hypothetical protein